MKLKFGVTAALTLALIVAALPALAAPKGKRVKAPVNVAGTVDSITDTALTVSKKVKGVAESTSVTLTADTKYVELSVGASVDIAKDAVVLALPALDAADTAAGVVVYTGTSKDSDALLSACQAALAAQIQAKLGKNAPKPAKGTPKPVPAIGKVKSTDNGKLVITPKDGVDVTLKLGAEMVVDKAADKARTDIMVGRAVNVALAVVGTAADAKVATTVVQMPDAKQGKGKGKGKKKL